MNKVKPFYIRITNEMSPQTAREIKEKCIKQGVAGDFHFNPADVKRWKYLGVCSQDGLCYSDFTENFYGEAQEITLDQLDEWFGIESQDTEWKNGDECIYMSHNVIHQFIGQCPRREGYGYIQAPGFEVNLVELSNLSKPETPQQKEEREKRDEAKEMIQYILDNYEEFDESATDYVINYLKECYHLRK